MAASSSSSTTPLLFLAEKHYGTHVTVLFFIGDIFPVAHDLSVDEIRPSSPITVRFIIRSSSPPRARTRDAFHGGVVTSSLIS